MSIKRRNILNISVGEVVDLLSNAYCSVINKNMPVKTMPSVMLWGPPGVGKSQAIRQIAKEIEERTGKRSCVTDVRLLLFNPIDLRGIPTANADKTLAVWLKPQIFHMDESDDVINILFLDEISAVPQSVQAAAYQITLDRVVGEHKLPENCIVIAAGNRVTDKSVVFKMPKALANRLCHIEIESNTESWIEWGIKNKINADIIGYLNYNNAMLMEFDSASDDMAFPTPRSWEMASNILNNVSDNIDEVFALVAGCIGMDAACELKCWIEGNSNVPDVTKIFKLAAPETPSRVEALHTLVLRMINYASRNPDEEGINNSISYSSKLPPEFRSMLFNGYLKIKEIRPILKKNHDFTDWLLRNGEDWEDWEDYAH